MPKPAEELQQEQWLANAEKAAGSGERARDEWWAGIEAEQKAFYLGVVRNTSIVEPRTPSEEDPGSFIPSSRAAMGESLSPAATQMLCDFDFQDWDRQIETDAKQGKLGWLDALADKARKENAEGRTTPL
jgi:hypothetical protein